MVDTQRFADRDVVARRYEYTGGDVLAFDLGASTDGVVDVVDDTLIIVVDGEQYETDLPEGASGAQATINNGVVTVELSRSEPDEDTDTE